jgi:hypothetical protein
MFPGLQIGQTSQEVDDISLKKEYQGLITQSHLVLLPLCLYEHQHPEATVQLGFQVR